MTLTAGPNHDRIERAQPEELRLPELVLVGRFADRPGKHAFFGDHDEEREVDGVNALAQNAALPTALTARFQARNRILKVIAINVAAQGLNRFERNTIASVEVSHFAFSYDDERFFMNAVLPPIQSEVNTAA